MNNEIPTRPDREELMQQEVARQQIAAEQADQNARFLAVENSSLRNRLVEGSNGFLHLLGFLVVLGAIVAAFMFLGSSTQETRQQAEAARQDAALTRQEANSANYRARVAQDAAYRAGQRSQAADAAAQQANANAMRAQQEAANKPTVILNPPPPPAVIVTPAEPAPVTTIPANPAPPGPSDPDKPLEGRIE